MSRPTHKTRISVVMSIYNEPLQWLRAAVESVLGQTLHDFELVIVCDNPDYEAGISYLRSIPDERVRIIVNPENLGPTKSFNIAIAASSGDYIARMDADDICLPERFARQAEYLDEHPQVSVCATDTHTIDEEGRIIRKNRYKKKHDPALNVISNSIAHPSVMMRRSLLQLREPLYNEEYKFSQDYELWTFLIMNGHKLHTIDEALLLYRKSSAQISSAKKSAQDELFRKAHRAFVVNWLISLDIAEETDTLEAMLEKSSQAYADAADEDRRFLTYIIYVLYYSLGTNDWKYRLKYLADRNMMVMRLGVIFTYRMLFSRHARREIYGING